MPKASRDPMGSGDATIATGRPSDRWWVQNTLLTSVCWEAGWRRRRDGFALEGRKGPF